MRNGRQGTIPIIYVDDIVVACNDVEIERLKKHLGTEFESKDLGDLRCYLGIEIARSKKGIVICQRKYTLDLLEETRMLELKSIDTPIEQNHNICAESGELLHTEGFWEVTVSNFNSSIYLISSKSSQLVHACTKVRTFKCFIQDFEVSQDR